MNGYPLLPAPSMLLDHLLGLVFLIHVVCMNFVATAPFVIAWYLLIKGEKGRQRARWMASALPVVFTFAINFGVAALLFVQALFSQRFLTSNVILGTTWLSVIGLLLVAFYGTYVVKRNLDKPLSPRLGGLAALIVGGLVWTIGIIMISNYFISTSQPEWMQLREHPAGVLRNFSFLPRALHFLVGAFAVTGFWMIWIARWKESRGVLHPDLPKFRHQGIGLATAATAVQVVIGIWFVLWQSQETWERLLSGSFISVVWMSGVAAGLLMLASLVIANFSPRPKLWTNIASGLLLYTLMGMISGREIVRLAAFGADFKLAELPAQPQTEAIRWFVLTLVLCVATLLALFRVLWKASRERAE